ncbi:hypothetical protein EON83_19060 [bacterium]|nr:MAG: hypothetical protein EON83_19060 [bacterium]
MSHTLQVRWQKQLETAQSDPSWQAQIEVRVLRFLLARYEGKGEEMPLAPFPFYRGQSPYGRAHLPLSQQQMGERLRHIAEVERQRVAETPRFFDWDRISYQDVLAHQRSEARRERFRNRRNRGYW